MTPLRVWMRGLFDLLDDARAALSDEEWSWFVGIATDWVGIEAARQVVAEALRATRTTTEEAA